MILDFSTITIVNGGDAITHFGGVRADDPRLTDERTALAHTHTVSEVAGAVAASDPRLVNARVPLAHSHEVSAIEKLESFFSTLVVDDNDVPVTDQYGEPVWA